METPLHSRSFLLPHSQPPYHKSSPPPNRRHHRQTQQQHGGFRLAMRHLTFQRISPNRIIISKFSLRHATSMSDQKIQIEPVDASGSAVNVENAKQEPEKSEPIPPPPEKPLPGDCCGSGCVRCVWDVYYEELEEYTNNLNKSKSEPIVNPKPS